LREGILPKTREIVLNVIIQILFCPFVYHFIVWSTDCHDFFFYLYFAVENSLDIVDDLRDLAWFRLSSKLITIQVICRFIEERFKNFERDFNLLLITSELEVFPVLSVLWLFLFCLFFALIIVALNNLDERSLLWLLRRTGPIKSCYSAFEASYIVSLKNPRIVKGD